jgi:hypothetical protein
MLNRRRRNTSFDQLKTPPVDDLMVSRRRDRDGPPKMMSNPQTHGLAHPLTSSRWAEVIATRNETGTNLSQ